MATHDDMLARRIREARERIGLSQEQLALRMNARGHDFRQQTIYKVETGNRRVTYGEAVDLAECLELTVNDFAISGRSGSLGALRERVDVVREGLEDAARAYAEILARLAFVADREPALSDYEARSVRDAIELESPAQVLRLHTLGERVKHLLQEPHEGMQGGFAQLLEGSIRRDESALRDGARDAIDRE